AESRRGGSPALSAVGRRRRADTAPSGPSRQAAEDQALIVVDTNVIAELMRAKPHPKVFAWVAAQPRATLYTTSLTQAEILYGIAALPQGRRRSALAAAADAMFTEDFVDRVLPFDGRAAARYAEIVATRRRAGSPIEV